ncbi:hypothetical protein QJS04_geneDACA000690 [Acorus gramineus]|uniref:Uncharacterized protein n=1 Tax=Acorus gramineus TaxID=55184 RepID=A0AAV9ASC0_ACOGR|nr:hypothetical protein QJS04_geneDACA000690 [Acorus gramineus]
MIQSVVRSAMKDPLKDCDAWPVWLAKMKEPSRATVNVGSSLKFMKYETDFGWGEPERMEHVHRDTAGTLVLDDARDEMGGFQVSPQQPHQGTFKKEMDHYLLRRRTQRASFVIVRGPFGSVNLRKNPLLVDLLH